MAGGIHTEPEKHTATILNSGKEDTTSETLKTGMCKPWQIDRERLRTERMDRMVKEILVNEAAKLIEDSNGKVF